MKRILLEQLNNGGWILYDYDTTPEILNIPIAAWSDTPAMLRGLVERLGMGVNTELLDVFYELPEKEGGSSEEGDDRVTFIEI